MEKMPEFFKSNKSYKPRRAKNSKQDKHKENNAKVRHNQMAGNQ